MTRGGEEAAPGGGRRSCRTRSSSPTRAARRPPTSRPRRSRHGWEKAGFKVTLDPLDRHLLRRHPEADRGQRRHLGRLGCRLALDPTVIPPLFDSRPNLTTASNGQDYGNYKSDKFNKLIDQAAATSRRRRADQVRRQDRRPARQGRRLHPAGDHEVLLPARLEGHRLHRTPRPRNGYPDLGADRREAADPHSTHT